MATIKTKALGILVSVATLAVLTSIFLPEVTSASWHLLHGSSVKFQAWQIPVPWCCRELGGNGFVAIQKVGRWNRPPSDVIVTTLEVPVGSAVTSQELKRARILVESKKGHYFVSGNEALLDGETGDCLTFGDSEFPALRRIHCDFLIRRLSIGYIGTKSDSYVLDSVIKGITASK